MVGMLPLTARMAQYRAGYTLSFVDHFNTLDIVHPTNPRGKWFPTRFYGDGVGASAPPRGPAGADPYYTGYQDSNRGVAVGFDNMSQSGSIVSLRTRAATTGEKLHNNNVGILAASLFSVGGIVFYPGNSEIVVEARYKIFPDIANAIHGMNPSMWILSCAPCGNSAPLKNELDIMEGSYTSSPALGVVGQVWANSVPDPDTGDFGLGGGYINNKMWDGNYHTVSCTMKHTSTVILYDGLEAANTSAYPANRRDVNSKNLPLSLNFTMSAAYSTYQAEWDAATVGMGLDIDWVKVWRKDTCSHYEPRTSISSLDLAYNGTGSIVLPSKLALWGDATVTEYVQIIPHEANEPGCSLTATYLQFPSYVTYDSNTRTVSVDFSVNTGNAGRMHAVVYAWDATNGSTCIPARFEINRGPNITTAATLAGTHGVSYSKDVYFECDVGRMTPKTIVITGLPPGLSHDGDGRITGTPVSAGNTNISITCTNNNSQSKQKTIQLQIA